MASGFVKHQTPATYIRYFRITISRLSSRRKRLRHWKMARLDRWISGA